MLPAGVKVPEGCAIAIVALHAKARSTRNGAQRETVTLLVRCTITRIIFVAYPRVQESCRASATCARRPTWSARAAGFQFWITSHVRRERNRIRGGDVLDVP